MTQQEDTPMSVNTKAPTILQIEHYGEESQENQESRRYLRH
jgi:hypothetical protein